MTCMVVSASGSCTCGLPFLPDCCHQVFISCTSVRVLLNLDCCRCEIDGFERNINSIEIQSRSFKTGGLHKSELYLTSLPLPLPEHLGNMPARTLPNFEDDPLTNAIKPPPDETPEERQRRLRSEHDAKAISDSIDEELESQRASERNEQKPVKILLLGESPLHLER